MLTFKLSGNTDMSFHTTRNLLPRFVPIFACTNICPRECVYVSLSLKFTQPLPHERHSVENHRKLNKSFNSLWKLITAKLSKFQINGPLFVGGIHQSLVDSSHKGLPFALHHDVVVKLVERCETKNETRQVLIISVSTIDISPFY